jgi:HAD superfamily hydrolase (TIGR01549 family)
MNDSPLTADTVVLDIDGTLLDSNFHHTVAWVRAFRAHGHDVAAWRVHRAIGMGGDRLVAAASDDEVERTDGDAIRDTWEQEFDSMLEEPVLLTGATALLDALRERGFQVVLASSAIPRHAQRALDLLGAEERADAWTTSDDAEESKPDPELVEAAVARVEGRRSVLVGDSVWDVEAGRRADIPVVGVLSGGTSRDELESAGAAVVLTDVAELAERLDEVLVKD